MKIAVINNFDSFVYNLVRYLREEGCEVDVQRNDLVSLQSLEKADGILLSPGPGIPIEAGALTTVIERFVNQKPMLGVCLGYQALAEHFGGTLSLAPKAIHGKSSISKQVANSVLFDSVPKTFEVGRYHSWIVDNSMPTALKTTAVCGDEIMAFEHNDLPIHGVQFHPESILTPVGRTIIRNWIQSVKTTLKPIQ